ADELAGDARRVLRMKHGDAWYLDANQVAVALDLRRPARREDQIADAVAGIEHGENHRRRELRRAFRRRPKKRAFELVNDVVRVGWCCCQRRWSHVMDSLGRS